MQYLVISFSHKNASIDIREKLAFNEDSSEVLLRKLLESSTIYEAILLSTCNRMELIMAIEDANSAFSAISECLEALAIKAQIEKDELEKIVEIFEGFSAIQHIFLVASSLDSLVIGETQISGQFKSAYKFSLNHHFCSAKILGNVMDFAFKCASSVRNQTGISKKPISIASVAVFVANNIKLREKKAVVIGLGEMGQLAIKHLLNSNFEVILVNRNFQKARDFADSLNNSRISLARFEDLANIINDHELVFSATASSEPIIKKSMIKKVDFTRHFFDIALPRDIEDLEDSDINLRLIDDLQCIVDENIGHRKDDMDAASEIVNNFVNDFFKRLNILSVEPIIKTLRELAKNASLSEIEKAIARGYLPSDSKKNVEKTIHNAFNIFLHTPTKNLKSIASSTQIAEIERTLKFLFSLSDEELQEAEKKHDTALKGEK